MSGSQLNTEATLPMTASGAPLVAVVAPEVAGDVPAEDVVPGESAVPGVVPALSVSSSSPQAARIGTDEMIVSPPTTPAVLEMNVLRVYIFPPMVLGGWFLGWLAMVLAD